MTTTSTRASTGSADGAAELADRPLEELVAAVAALADERLADDVTVVAARLR